MTGTTTEDVERLAHLHDRKARKAFLALTDGVSDHAEHATRADLSEARKTAATLRALAAERDELRRWNAAMVEKAASGGTLDGYRELGAKAAAAEAERDALKAELASGSFYKEADIDALMAAKAERDALAARVERLTVVEAEVRGAARARAADAPEWKDTDFVTVSLSIGALRAALKEDSHE